MRDSTSLHGYHMTPGQRTFARIQYDSGQHTLHGFNMTHGQQAPFARITCDLGITYLCKDTMSLRGKTLSQEYHVAQGQRTFEMIPYDSETAHVCKDIMLLKDNMTV